MITIVIGKPGAGKSYDTVRRLTEDIIDRFNRGADIPVIVTNLRLNEEALRSYIQKQVKNYKTFDIINLTDEDMSNYRWWRNLPDESLIIIDEVQFYWSAAKIDKEDQQDLIEYLSTHRHRQQNYILLTQSLTSVSVDIRRYAEIVIEVLNAKSVTIPFPISIPLRDLQTLLRGFGVTSQLYRTREGLLEGTYKVAWEGELKVIRTQKNIYKLYNTNITGKEGDGALPYALGPGAPVRALKWFLFKHGGGIFLKTALIVIPCIVIVYKMHVKKSILTTPVNPLQSSKMVKNESKMTENENNVVILPGKIVGDGWTLQNGDIQEINVNARTYEPSRLPID